MFDIFIITNIIDNSYKTGVEVWRLIVSHLEFRVSVFRGNFT